MHGRHEVKMVPERPDISSRFRPPKRGPHQGLSGGRAPGHDEFGSKELKLGLQPGFAGSDFPRIGLFMQPPLADWFPLEMLHGVGYVKLPSIEAGGFQTR